MTISYNVSPMNLGQCAANMRLDVIEAVVPSEDSSLASAMPVVAAMIAVAGAWGLINYTPLHIKYAIQSRLQDCVPCMHHFFRRRDGRMRARFEQLYPAYGIKQITDDYMRVSDDVTSIRSRHRELTQITTFGGNITRQDLARFLLYVGNGGKRHTLQTFIEELTYIKFFTLKMRGTLLLELDDFCQKTDQRGHVKFVRTYELRQEALVAFELALDTLFSEAKRFKGCLDSDPNGPQIKRSFLEAYDSFVQQARNLSYQPGVKTATTVPAARVHEIDIFAQGVRKMTYDEGFRMSSVESMDLLSREEKVEIEAERRLLKYSKYRLKDFSFVRPDLSDVLVPGLEGNRDRELIDLHTELMQHEDEMDRCKLAEDFLCRRIKNGFETIKEMVRLTLSDQDTQAYIDAMEAFKALIDTSTSEIGALAHFNGSSRDRLAEGRRIVRECLTQSFEPMLRTPLVLASEIKGRTSKQIASYQHSLTYNVEMLRFLSRAPFPLHLNGHIIVHYALLEDLVSFPVRGRDEFFRNLRNPGNRGE